MEAGQVLCNPERMAGVSLRDVMVVSALTVSSRDKDARDPANYRLTGQSTGRLKWRLTMLFHPVSAHFTRVQRIASSLILMFYPANRLAIIECE
jgi:hypothetical protein